MIEYIWEAFRNPFKVRLFWLMLLIFIPVSTFGIWYISLGGVSAPSFWSTFTPKSLFSFTVPLMAIAILDGILSFFEKYESLRGDDDSPEKILMRDSIILAFAVLLIQCVIISVSIFSDSMINAVLGSFIAIIFWIFSVSSRKEFSSGNTFDPTGGADATSASSITN